MRVMVVGSGGREHALAWKITASPLCEYLVLAPGNPGSAALCAGGKGETVAIAADDIAGLLRVAREQRIDLTIVGPEVPLTLGIVDEFAKAGLKAWGPSKAAAKLEGSKVEMKEFLRRHGIPTASFRLFDRAADAHAHIDEHGAPIVVKADGLAAGKGVTVAHTVDEAHDAVKRIMEQHQFGRDAGRKVVLEDILRGEEISVFAFCDGRNAVLCDYVQDHKQAFDGDRGPNTGGMGAFSPAPGLITSKLEDEIVRRILVPTMSGLAKEGRPYVGLLYIGLMLTDSGPKVIEYNVRFGDPECQVLMLRLRSDLLATCLACVDGTLDTVELDWDPRTAVCVNLCSGGYPGAFTKGHVITGLDHPTLNGPAARATVFHAGTAIADGKVVTAGGRVLSVVALGADVDAARAQAYAACDLIQFTDKHCRRDIGRRAEARTEPRPDARPDSRVDPRARQPGR